MPLKIVAKGPIIDIYKWAPTNEALNTVFFDCPNVSEPDKRKITNSLKMICSGGYPRNREKFKHVEDKFFEIKPTSQLRILGIKSRRDDKLSFIILLCVRKKKDDLRRQDIDKAKDLLSIFAEEQDG